MPLLFNILLDVLARKDSQERKKRSEEQKEEKKDRKGGRNIIHITKEEVNPSLFRDDMNLHIENPEESTCTQNY